MTNANITGTSELLHEVSFLEVHSYWRNDAFISEIRDGATGTALGRRKSGGLMTMLATHTALISHAAVIAALVSPADVATMTMHARAIPGMEPAV